VDRAALAGVICRIAEFIADHQGVVAEIDVNPLIAAGGRVLAVDALIVKR
jgi:acetyl-CoA synthetase